MSNARVFLACPASRRALPKKIDFKQLADFPLVLPAPTNGLRVIIDTVAKRMSVKLDIFAEADSVFAQEALVRECGCYMLKGEFAVAADQKDRNFSTCAIENPRLLRRFVLSTVQQKPLSRAARHVAALIPDMLPARG
jgi:hypothetical protein